MLLAVLLLLEAGCRTTSADVQRWATTQNGPTKLVAVMNHAKYPTELRVEAALTLVTMQPRGGRRVGIDLLLETLSTMPPRLRDPAVPLLVNGLVERVGAPPAGPDEPDGTLPVKDALAAIHAGEGGGILTDPELKAATEEALTRWAMQDFVRRVDSPGQRVGMQQMLSRLGAKSVVGLPGLLEPGGQKIEQLAQIIAEVGDDKTKREAARALIMVVRDVARPAWRQAKDEQLRREDAEAYERAGPKNVGEHLDGLQEAELLKLFASMKRIGQAPALEFLASFGSDPKRPDEHRKGALAALEGHMKAPPERVLSDLFSVLEAANTDDSVRALVLARLAEAPRKRTIERLLELMHAEDAEVRFAATELALRTSGPENVEGMLREIGRLKRMSVGEPLRYGRLLGDIDGFDVEVVDSYISNKSAPVTARLSALGYYYAYGTKAQIDALEAVSREQQRVPACAKDDDECRWRCDQQDVETIGDFFTLCVQPHMAERTESKPRPKDKNAAVPPAKASQRENKAQ